MAIEVLFAPINEVKKIPMSELFLEGELEDLMMKIFAHT